MTGNTIFSVKDLLLIFSHSLVITGVGLWSFTVNYLHFKRFVLTECGMRVPFRNVPVTLLRRNSLLGFSSNKRISIIVKEHSYSLVLILSSVLSNTVTIEQCVPILSKIHEKLEMV